MRDFSAIDNCQQTATCFAMKMCKNDGRCRNSLRYLICRKIASERPCGCWCTQVIRGRGGGGASGSGLRRVSTEGSRFLCNLVRKSPQKYGENWKLVISLAIRVFRSRNTMLHIAVVSERWQGVVLIRGLFQKFISWFSKLPWFRGSPKYWNS